MARQERHGTRLKKMPKISQPPGIQDDFSPQLLDNVCHFHFFPFQACADCARQHQIKPPFASIPRGIAARGGSVMHGYASGDSYPAVLRGPSKFRTTPAYLHQADMSIRMATNHSSLPTAWCKMHFLHQIRNYSITPGNSAWIAERAGFRRFDNAQHFQVIPTKVGIQIFFFDVRLPSVIEQLPRFIPARESKVLASCRT